LLLLWTTIKEDIISNFKGMENLIYLLRLLVISLGNAQNLNISTEQTNLVMSHQKFHLALRVGSLMIENSQQNVYHHLLLVMKTLRICPK
jgi:hypothetical protein